MGPVLAMDICLKSSQSLSMHPDITTYNLAQSPANQSICDHLAAEISRGLPLAESRLWHGGPVWFLAGNPIVGYWVRKPFVALLFWSGQSFDTPGLLPTGKFKAAEAHFTDVAQISGTDMQRWLAKAQAIQWDYKNIVKRRGVLEKFGKW